MASSTLAIEATALRLVDKSSCAGQEMAISWSQSGPPGPQGIAGPQGAPGPQVRPGLRGSPARRVLLDQRVPLDQKARRAHLGRLGQKA
jgi:hypothetical protein